MKLIPVDNVVGKVLSHDITEIVPDRFKGPACKRGQIIREEDVSRLRDLGKENIAVRDLGKENIAVLDLGPGWLHEDDAACRLAKAASGDGIMLSAPSKGKVNLIASVEGLLKNNVEQLNNPPGCKPLNRCCRLVR